MLYKLARSLPRNSIIVELGSYLGASSVFLGIGAKSNDSLVYCVDTWENDGMTEGKRDTYSEWAKNVQHLTNVLPLRGRNNEIAPLFTNGIDLLFIDSDHSYEAIKEDITNWLPKLRNNGIIVLHDVGWAEGIQRAIREDIKTIVKRERLLPNMYIGYMGND